MQSSYPGTYAYLLAHYDRLVPKCVSRDGTRDVPNATSDTWYQYGRTQALTAFINTPKLIVGVLSKEPMYAMDTNDILTVSYTHLDVYKRQKQASTAALTPYFFAMSASKK